jgi:hypothetical protein
MQRYWWVNHRQTVRQEIAGRYLWSPKTEAGGIRSQFYENMRNASPGDFVLSFANSAIGALGTVADYAISAPKPSEFGQIGAYWATDGWLLPVSWQPLATPVTPKQHLSEIANLLPLKYSPIQSKSGNGNQKAYLTGIGKPLFDLIISKAGISRPLPIWQTSQRELVASVEHEIEVGIEGDNSLSRTEKDQLVRARRGQGDFRRNVLAIEAHCKITGINNPSLLIASHMKPWRSCSTALERLDGNNGLMLAPHVDYLFDRGFLGFEDDGSVLVSTRLHRNDLQKLGLHDGRHLKVTPFSTSQLPYLTYHRNEIFMRDQ